MVEIETGRGVGRRVPAHAVGARGELVIDQTRDLASGRVTEQTAPALAATGVDLISVGWITHSAPTLDIGLDFDALG